MEETLLKRHSLAWVLCVWVDLIGPEDCHLLPSSFWGWILLPPLVPEPEVPPHPRPHLHPHLGALTMAGEFHFVIME